MSGFRIVLIAISVGALFLALAIPLVIAHLSRSTGFAVTEHGGPLVVASDTGTVPPMLVRDPSLGIRGTPDYVLEVDLKGRRQLAPVEVKPKRRSPRLYESDRLQIGAYLLGLRAVAGDRASPIGYVRYETAHFEVTLTSELEQRIAATVAAIRRGRSGGVVHRSHNSPARCRGCAVRALCDESLAQ